VNYEGVAWFEIGDPHARPQQSTQQALAVDESEVEGRLRVRYPDIQGLDAAFVYEVLPCSEDRQKIRRAFHFGLL